jgi:membrane dipeptidase
MENIHKNANVYITHDHSMIGLAERREQGERAVFSKHYAPLFRQGGVNVIGWVVGGDGADREHPWWGSLKWLDMLWIEAKESQDTLAVCLNYQDIENALAAGRIAIVLTMEGGIALEKGPYPGSLTNLRILYQLGLRSLQLVGRGWNQTIEVIDEDTGTTSGLSNFGKNVIREMNQLGIVIDTAHIPDPDPVFQDVIEISQNPVIDSHRGVRGATDIPRNMSDERIRAIAKTGGVIGLHFFSVVLTNEENRRATVGDLIRHIDHIVDIAGIDHVSLGPDFVDVDLVNLSPNHFAEGIDDITKLPQVTDALVKHGYSEIDIRKILGENILRVYKQVIG